MTTVWRLLKTRYAATAFDGESASRYGGRWNSRGRRMVYCSSTLALATLEVLAHLEATAPLAAYSYFAVEVPERSIADVEIARLPPDWRTYPAPAKLQRLGDAWLEAASSAVLRVPSVVVPSEFNFLLNPAHPDFAKLKRGRRKNYSFDPRLIARGRESRGKG